MTLTRRQIITVILLLALVFSLPVVIFLTRKRQDIRPKAMQGKADFLLQLVNPDDLTKSTVGKNIDVLVFLRLTDSSAKVSGVDFLLLYDKDKLDVVDRVPYISSVYPTAPFTDAPIVTSGVGYPAEGDKYNYIRIAEIARRPDAELPKGTFQLAKVTFRARSTGSATVKFPDNNSVLEVTGIGISVTPANGPSPTVEPTSSPTPIISPTVSPSPTIGPSPTAEPSPTASPTPTTGYLTPTPTFTPTPTINIGNSPTPTVTPIVISGLIANYKMDELSGTSVGDSKGSNNGSANGTTIVDGKSGKARSFNGQNDQVDISSNFGIGTSNASVAMWVNVPSASDKGAFIKIGGKDAGFGIGVGNSNFDNFGNKLIMLYEFVRWIPTNTSIGTGWHHIAMVIDVSGVPTAYLDGQSAGSYPGGNTRPPAASASIGGYLSSEGQRNFAGIIDEVQIYSRALSASEVAGIYSGNINPVDINPTVTSSPSPTTGPVPSCDPNSWGNWSTCSASCGGGTQSHTNACGATQSRQCNTQACPTEAPWRCYSDSDCQQGWTCDNGNCIKEINEPPDKEE